MRWMRRRPCVESFTIFSSIARVPAETSSAVRASRAGRGRRLRSRNPLPPPTTAAMPSAARNGVSSPAPPTRLLTPSTMKLAIPNPPASTTGTPTVSQRPRRRGTETARERGACTVPSSGAVPAAQDPGAGGAGARRPGRAVGPGRDGIAPGRDVRRCGDGFRVLMGTADLPVDGAEVGDGEDTAIRGARGSARGRTLAGPGRGPRRRRPPGYRGGVGVGGAVP